MMTASELNEDRVGVSNANPFTWDQVRGPAERLVLGTVAYFLGKYKLDTSMAADITMLVMLVFWMAWGWWINRPQSIKQSATAIPGTLVIEARPGAMLSSVADTAAQDDAVKRVLAPSTSASISPSTKVQAA